MNNSQKNLIVESYPNKFNVIWRKVQPFLIVIAKIITNYSSAQRLIELRWLPHHTSPKKIEKNIDDTYVEEYYKEKWHAIKAELISKVYTYDTDRLSQSIFTESLELHEIGKYRAVCRVIFPEIERLIRLEFYPEKISGLSSIRHFRDDLRNPEYKFLINIDDTLFGLPIMETISKTIYKNIKTPEDLKLALQDDIPNRHAVVHGLVDYNTHKNSINSIIIMDYVLRAISAVKTMKIGDREEILKLISKEIKSTSIHGILMDK